MKGWLIESMINYDIIYFMYIKLKVKIFMLLRYLLNRCICWLFINMLCEIFRVILVDDCKNVEYMVFDLLVRSVKEILVCYLGLGNYMILNEINCVLVSIC